MNLEKRLKIIHKAAFSIMGSTGGLPPSSLKMTKSSLIKGQSPPPIKVPPNIFIGAHIFTRIDFSRGGESMPPY